jgi:UDP-glucuronate 4-epimerase
MAKVLVTGGAGFIGSHLIKRLIETGEEVVCVDNFNDYYPTSLKIHRIRKFLGQYSFPTYKVDIYDFSRLEQVFKKHKFDYIVHLAAQAGVRASIEQPLDYAKSNVQGTINIFELARRFNVPKVLFASSSSVYGNSFDAPFSENHEVDRPISPYAATKKACELIAHSYSAVYSMSLIGLRFFTVYGPWGRPDMAYYKFAKKIMNNQTIDVYNYGKHLKRDFTYIDDIIEGILQASKLNSPYDIINLGNDKPVELGHFINLLEKYLNKQAEKNLLPMQQGDVMTTHANINKAKVLLGYKPQTTIENGLEKFVNWFNNYHY